MAECQDDLMEVPQARDRTTVDKYGVIVTLNSPKENYLSGCGLDRGAKGAGAVKGNLVVSTKNVIWRWLYQLDVAYIPVARASTVQLDEDDPGPRSES